MCKIYFCVFLFVFVVPSYSAYTQIFLDLGNEPPGHTVTQLNNNISDSKYSINVIHINPNVSFFIIQVHTFVENVTLSFKDPLELHSYTQGTNIGLVWKSTSNNVGVAEYFLFRDQDCDQENLTVLLIVKTYTKDDPIPGGCNLSFETELAPYQKVNQTDAVITVMSQPPSQFGEFCHESNITTEMYYLYLNEYDNSSNEYFQGIQKMVSAENITKYGTKVPYGFGPSKYKQMYNKYTGTGRIFAVVSTYKGRSSSYVPAASFGCNINAWEEDCLQPVGIQWKLVTALLLICGIFICLGGHRFFKTGLFIIGYTCGVIIMQIVVTVDDVFSTEGQAIYSLIMGIIVAFMWVFLWWKFGVPVVTVQLTFLLAGFLIASILFYTQLGYIYIFADKLAFWVCFTLVLVISLIPLLYLRPLFHIIALSLVGSYAAVVAMNYYIGGNLPYIMINTLRRITVKDFGMSVIDPPYQLIDVCQTVLWAVLFGFGIYIQHIHSIGKPPFPPHRSGNEFISSNERSPLLRGTAPASEQPPPYSVYPRLSAD